MLTWYFRYTGLNEYITKINFTYLILLFVNVTTKNCEIVYVARLCSSHCISIGQHGGNWPVTPKDIQVLLWNLWRLPHMAKGTLQMWLRMWTIILDYMQLQRSSKEAEWDMTTKGKEFSCGNRDQSYSCGQLPELEETKILSWALQKPCSYPDFSSVRL